MQLLYLKFIVGAIKGGDSWIRALRFGLFCGELMLSILNKKSSSAYDCEAPEDCPIKKMGAELAELGAVTLDQLMPGSTAIVKSLSHAQPRLCCKLHAMGIVEGQSIVVKQKAPFGDPISISTLGYTLSLRLCEAQAIEIVPA